MMQFLVEVEERDTESGMSALRSAGIEVDAGYGAVPLGNGHAVLRCRGDDCVAEQAPGVLGVFSDGPIDAADPLSGCDEEHEDPYGPLEGCDEPGDPDD